MAKCEAWAQRWPGAVAVLLTAVLFAGVFAAFTPGFQTNDDAQLAMIASGKGIALAPDEHLIFTNVVLGHLLKALYTVCPALPWYGLYLVLAQYVAQTVTLYTMVARGYSRWRTLLYLLYFATIGLFYLNNLQFTTTACLVGQSGLLAAVTALRERDAIGIVRARWLLAIGVALLVLASLIRLESFVLTAFVGVPVVALAVGRPLDKASLARGIAAGLTCCGLVLALATYHSAYYRRDPQWEEFLRYNKLRIKFNDYAWTSYTPETAGIFAAARWSENDHAMIQDWFYDEPALYSYEQLQGILAAYPWQSSRLNADYALTCLRPLWRDKSLWPLALILPLLMASTPGTRREWLIFGGTLLAAGVLLVVVAMCNKAPPSRVYFPALTFVVLPLLVAARAAPPVSRRGIIDRALQLSTALPFGPRRRNRALWQPAGVQALILLAVVAAAMAASRQIRVSKHTARDRRAAEQCLAALPETEDRLYVAWATDFPFEVLSPFDNLQSLGQRRLLMVSWPQGTPIATAMKRRFGIENLAQALAVDERVYLLGDATSHPLLARFLAEHCGASLRFSPRYDGQHEFDVVGRFDAGTSSPTATTAQQLLPAVQRPSQFR